MPAAPRWARSAAVLRERLGEAASDRTGGVLVTTSEAHGDPVSQAAEGRWVVHRERPVYESDWVRVGLSEISQPSGERFEHHTVWFPPVAMTVMFDDDREHVLMAWRHRFAPDLYSWEIPGGIIDGSEDPKETAVREIEEETGYRPRSIEHLVTFEPAVGMLSNPNHIFLALGAERIADPTEVNEGSFQWVRYSELPDMIRAGKVGNSGALIAFLHVLALDEKKLGRN